ncbi:MAG: spermidine synthase [Xanthobacteraceae bacterium]
MESDLSAEMISGAAPATLARPASRPALLLATFTVAIFVSAALLFLVQPMFTKMILPRFGGAPAVWSVAIVFFQAALLAGYAYAHLLTRYASGRQSIVIHVAVMLIACVALPLAIAPGWGRPPPVGETLWLLGLFAVSIGLPFFALAANSPLLQAWFARTDHPAAHDPYFLYAASNVGSFLALVSYPLAVEPFVRLGDQSRYWSFGFYGLILLIAACSSLLWRSPERGVLENDAVLSGSEPTWGDVGRWILLAAVPSGLLVAVTAHISTDVAAVPLLWVLPLALYLLTFVIVFQRRPIIPHWLVIEIQPLFVIALVAVIIFDPIKTIVGLVAVHVAVFFVCVLMCHGELAKRRPPARHLTAFYMWMSAGGMIGGIAAGLIAPHVFNWVAEYPLLLALAVLCRPGPILPQQPLWRYGVIGGVVVAAALLVVLSLQPVTLEETAFNWTVGAVLAVCVLVSRMPLAFAAAVGFILLANHSIVEQAGAMFVRSFFGVVKVSETSDGQYRLLQHGTTLHGGERIRDTAGEPITERPEMLLYYWEGSGIAQTFNAVRARIGGPVRYAVIGLGTGTLACQAEPQDTVHYYEIDPAIIRIARDPNLFSFISECRPDVPIILGDARLTLAEAPDGAYDLIVVDAFSSDAIPIHLLTREAMAVYLKKLSPHGMVVIHVSNRHLELASVVGGIAGANGAIARVSDGSNIDESANPYKFSGTVVAVALSEEDFGPLAQSADWEVQEPDPNQWVWTDDYSNIVGSVLRQMRN